MTGKTALILGATGGSGHAVARALMGDGWQITALHRHPESHPVLTQVNPVVEVDCLAVESPDGARTSGGQLGLGLGLDP